MLDKNTYNCIHAARDQRIASACIKNKKTKHRRPKIATGDMTQLQQKLRHSCYWCHEPVLHRKKNTSGDYKKI